MTPSTATRARILWPLGLLEWLQQQDTTSCYLVGLVVSWNSTQGDRMVVLAVVGALNSNQEPNAAHKLLQGDVQLTSPGSTGPCKPHLAVLGVWGAQPAAAVTSNAQLQLPQNSPWLRLHGSQQLTVYLQQHRCTGRPRRLLAPWCSVQHSRLPLGTTVVQVFLYSPALHDICILMQQPQPQQQHTSHPPWLVRPPGTLNLTSVLQMLQEAHCSIHHCQQQLQQKQQQPCSHKSSSFSSQSSINTLAAASESQAAWHTSAPLLAWPCVASNRSRGWRSGALRPQCWRPTRRQQQPHGEPLVKHSAGSSSSPPGGSSNGTCRRAHDSSIPNDMGSGASSSNGILPGLLQHMLGLLVALLLLYYQEHLLQMCAVAGMQLQQKVLQPHIAWLKEAHPGGIKLHFELSYLLSSGSEIALQLSAALYTAVWPFMGPTALLMVALAAAVGGAVTGLAAAADVLLVVLSPVELVYVGAAGLYRLQLRCLRATWRLLRGKQKVRRFSDRSRHQQQQLAQAAASPGTSDQDATSSDEVSVEQLIVGVLLFTPLVGLMPTTSAWYLSACCCHGVVVLLRLLLVQLAVLLRMQGLQVLVRRWYRPGDFPGDLMVELLAAASEEGEAGRSDIRAVAYTAATGRGGRGVVQVGAGPSAESVVEQQPGSSNSSTTSQQAVLSYYHAYFEPLSYASVLRQTVHRVSAVNAEPGQGWLRGAMSWAGAVLAGSNWGLELMGLQTMHGTLC